MENDQAHDYHRQLAPLCPTISLDFSSIFLLMFGILDKSTKTYLAYHERCFRALLPYPTRKGCDEPDLNSTQRTKLPELPEFSRSVTYLVSMTHSCSSEAFLAGKE